MKKEKLSPLHSKLSAGFLFLEGIFISAWMRCILSFLPGTYRLRWMGKALNTQPPFLELSPSQLNLISRIQLAVARVHRYVPWSTECYTQALTAKFLLNQRGIPSILTIGFKKAENGEVQGHAWLTINEWVVTGMRYDLNSYIVNGKFY